MLDELNSLIDGFLKNADSYLVWKNMHDVIIPGASFPEDPRVHTSESLLVKLKDAHERYMDVREAAVAIVDELAPRLEAEGHDSTSLLKWAHFVKGGGGPVHAYEIWPDLKVQLQRLKIAPGAGAHDAATSGDLMPSIDKTDQAILLAIAKRQPLRSTLDDIEQFTKCARPTALARTNALIKSGLVHRPEGPRGGACLTDSGSALVKTISPTISEPK